MDKPRIVGPTIMIPVGGGAVMTAVNPGADPHIEWSLRYSSDLNDPKGGRFSAADVVESYAYLLSASISMTEATRRLRVLRAAVRERRFWTRAAPLPASAPQETPMDQRPADGNQQ